MKLLVRNTVKDYEAWKAIFDEELDRARGNGIELENLWRCVDNLNEVFFIFAIKTREEAEAFMADPKSAEVGQRSGVIDGAAWFVE